MNIDEQWTCRSRSEPTHKTESVRTRESGSLGDAVAMCSSPRDDCDVIPVDVADDDIGLFSQWYSAQ
jgi:hypothetical protein